MILCRHQQTPQQQQQQQGRTRCVVGPCVCVSMCLFVLMHLGPINILLDIRWVAGSSIRAVQSLQLQQIGPLETLFSYPGSKQTH